jgi:hypothetical protein
VTRVFTDMEIWVEVRRRVLTGEPWLTMPAIARFTGRSEEDMARKFSGLRKHPRLKGFYKITDLETLPGKGGA